MREDLIKTVILDDESIARSIIRNYLKNFREIEVVGEFENGEQALKFICEASLDLIFIDIEMPGLSGIRVMEQLSPKNDLPVLIVTTAYKDYALSAFELQVFDYLLKPFDQERFNTTLKRALRHIVTIRNSNLGSKVENLLDSISAGIGTNVNQIERFTIKKAGNIYFVAVAEIDYISVEDGYVVLNCDQKKHLLNDSLNNIMTKLDKRKFLRIHRSTIVNINRIAEFKPYFNGEFYVHLKNGIRLKTGRTYTDDIKKFFDL